ncbi:hypothetical protein IV73_GL000655 [Weissella kandleri]|uniref:D-alanyl-D-alanine dipeptidase n=1 Tax=Weissella kandleri TaxID=1616 RepID=A0A0R2JDR5_9LACO|nr:M15 family metallopeptidase [Weissella kandleri]KRN75486.1 hypothetical protein IV73_GL000655 [Weissella kandleri]
MDQELYQPIPKDIATWEWSTTLTRPITENHEPLVPLGLLPERIIVQPAYFIQGLSGAMSELYARKQVQKQLAYAASLLPDNYHLVIFDAWRSVTTQAALFHSLKRKISRNNPDWTKQQVVDATLTTVAAPSRDKYKPSPHNTGGAIDLTIADDQGLMLDMASPFDDFRENAQTNYLECKENLTPAEVVARDNRRLLYNIMHKAGFTNLINEWWHFDYGNQNWAQCDAHPEALYGAIKPTFPWVTIID